MDAATLSLMLNVVLVITITVLMLRLTRVGHRIAGLNRDVAFAKGYEQGRKELLDSIRYEQEVFECRRVGLMRRETAVKIRESVFLGTLRLAQSEHEVVLSSEINQENLWTMVDRATQTIIGPEVGSIVRTFAHGVQQQIAAHS